MPFPKGQSGNPGGRPKKNNVLHELCVNATPQSFARIIDIAKHGEEESQRLKANQWICEQAWGKAAQAVSVESEDMTALTAVLQVIAKAK